MFLPCWRASVAKELACSIFFFSAFIPHGVFSHCEIKEKSTHRSVEIVWQVNVLLRVAVRGPLVSSSDEYMLYIPSHITWPEHHQPSAPSAHQPTTQHSAGPTLCLTNFSFYFITTPGHINSNVICNECQLKKHFKTKSKMINKHPIYKYNINICIFCSQSILYNKLYNLTILNIHMLITIIVNLLFVHVYVNIFRSRRLIMP